MSRWCSNGPPPSCGGGRPTIGPSCPARCSPHWNIICGSIHGDPVTCKRAKHSHPKKPKHWIVDQYFARFNNFRRDRWVFGDRTSGAHLVKFIWTNIIRHQMVTKGASPDDPVGSTPVVLSVLTQALTRVWIPLAGKQALGRAPNPPIPSAVMTRSKTGFSIPMAEQAIDQPDFSDWRRIPTLAHPKCNWALRWSYAVACQFGISVSSSAVHREQ